MSISLVYSHDYSFDKVYISIIHWYPTKLVTVYSGRKVCIDGSTCAVSPSLKKQPFSDVLRNKFSYKFQKCIRKHL